jgi:uncharacterized protein (DUF736 family)
MIIGNFAYNADHDTYAGAITTLTLQRNQVVFRPTEKNGEKEPDYRILHEHDGATVELGAAWKRSSERGRAFLSVLLDDPALPSSLNAAMFLSEQEERATLVWQRQARKPSAAEPEAAPGKRPKRGAAARGPRLG